jgi:hypothetical protein
MPIRGCKTRVRCTSLAPGVTGVAKPMYPPPIALGLVHCEKVIVEERTRNATITSTFTKLLAERIAISEPQNNPADTVFSSDDLQVVIFEGPGDSTRRPRRPNNPRDWPRREPLGGAKSPSDAPSPPSDWNG